MKKANVLGITTMKILFLLCGSLGYAAFGDDMHTWKHPSLVLDFTSHSGWLPLGMCAL